MFGSKTFEAICGPLDPGCARFSTNGIGIRCKDGSYKCWNDKEKRLTNVTCFSFDMPGMFFVLPTIKVHPGDIIIENGSPKYVISTDKAAGSIKCVDYNANQIVEVLPVRHVFFGRTYFYGKICSPFSMSAFKGKDESGFIELVKLQLLSKVMNGFGMTQQRAEEITTGLMTPNAANPMAAMAQMMPMMMLFGGGNFFGGGGNIFNDMFKEMSFLDPTEEDEEEEDNDSKTE